MPNIKKNKVVKNSTGTNFTSNMGANMPIIEEDFENPTFADWRIYGSRAAYPDARVGIGGLDPGGSIGMHIPSTSVSSEFFSNGPNHSNYNALLFDSASNIAGGDLSGAIWTVDLSGFTNGARLTFHHLNIGDDANQAPDDHAGRLLADSLAISLNGGQDWYELETLGGDRIARDGNGFDSGLWKLMNIDLDDQVAQINANFGTNYSIASSNVKIKFLQYGDSSFPNDGWAIDNLKIVEQYEVISANIDKGAFHAFSIAGENNDDYFYRAAAFGNVGPNTPILVAVHGTNSAYNYDDFAGMWQKYIEDNGVPSNGLIIVNPVFVNGGRFDTGSAKFGKLSWNDTTNAQADQALLQTLAEIDAAGLGDASQMHLWGFSEGAQFASRFTAAHPNDVAAVVIGAPSSYVYPSNDVFWPHGFAADPDVPMHTQLDLNGYLQTPMQIWVGEDDNNPNANNLDRGNDVVSILGEDRLERGVNQYEALYQAALDAGLSPSDVEFELFIAEGVGHNRDPDDLPQIFDFLFKDRSNAANPTDPVIVETRMVTTPATQEERSDLPPSETQFDPGQTAYLEIWVKAPAGQSLGLDTASFDIFVEPDTGTIDPASIQYGQAFTQVGSASVTGGFLRDLSVDSVSSGTGVGEYVLLGRVEITVESSINGTQQMPVVVMDSAANGFTLDGGVSVRSAISPVDAVIINDTGAAIQGSLFKDANWDGVWDGDEDALSGVTVTLKDSNGNPYVHTTTIDPDDVGDNGYLLHSPWVTFTAQGSDIGSPIVQAESSGSAGSDVFGLKLVSGSKSTAWNEGGRELLIDFTAPTSRVSIDVFGSGDIGQLQIFDENHNLLGSVQSSTLNGTQTLTLSSTTPIAYAVATGHGPHYVKLDNLQFDFVPTVTTDAHGAYSFTGLNPGSYTVSVDAPGYSDVSVQTLGAGDQASGVNGANQLNSLDANGNLGFVDYMAAGFMMYADNSAQATLALRTMIDNTTQTTVHTPMAGAVQAAQDDVIMFDTIASAQNDPWDPWGFM